jgi:hypothetical protein
MATIPAQIIIAADGVTTVLWADVTEADTGQAVNLARFPDRTVQVTGDFTTSGAITMEGSNDGVTFATLHDPQGNEIVLTDSSLVLIAENPLYIRPRATAGSSVAMDVYVVGAPR